MNFPVVHSDIIIQCHVHEWMCIPTGGQPISRRRAGEAAGVRPDSSEGEAKPEKPPRSQYHGRGEREGGGDSGGEGRGRRKKKRRSERGSSLHEELLEFISQEWASLEIAEVCPICIVHW